MSNSAIPQDRTEAGATRETIAELQAIIGEGAVLLPLPWGQKRPTMRAWQKTNISAMSDTGYLRTLEGGNVGVLVGEPSNGLCSIDIDDDQAAVEFEALNPLLAGTLQTRGRRGRNFWVQVDGEYPSQTPLKTTLGAKWGEFRSTGGQTVIWGQHPDTDKPYEMIIKASPVRIRFDKIIWPDNVELPWIEDDFDRLVAEHGELFFKGERGALTLNQPCVAAKVLIENPVIFEPDEDEFYTYCEDTGLYMNRSEREIAELVSRELKAIADQAGEKLLAAKRTKLLLDGIVGIAKGQLGSKSRGVFARNHTRIHVQNGMLEIAPDGGKLLNFHPNYYSRNQIPIAFDPKATCPRFLNEFLRPVLPPDDIRLIQLYGGSILLGRNLSQRILFLTGAAGSGKSTLLDLIESLIGRGNVAELRAEHLSSRFELYDARAAILLAGKDVRSDFLNNKNASFLKKLCGGDQFSVEKKGGKRVSTMGIFHIAITSNAVPQIQLDDDYDAWDRRLAVVEFNRPMPRAVIPEFSKVLIETEGSGILNFFLEGAMQFLGDLAAGRGLVLSQAQQARLTNVLRASDSIRVFAEDGVVACPGAQVTSQVLYASYMDFCETRDWAPKTSNTFSHDVAPFLDSLYGGHRANDIDNKRGYRGIRIKD